MARTRRTPPASPPSREWIETITGIIHIDRTKAGGAPIPSYLEVQKWCCDGRANHAHFATWEHVEKLVRRAWAFPNEPAPRDVEELVRLCHGQPFYGAQDALAAYRALKGA